MSPSVQGPPALCCTLRPAVHHLPDASQPGPACPDADLAAAAAAAATALAPPVIKCPSGQWPPGYSVEDGAWESSNGNGSKGGGAAAFLQRLANASLGVPASAPPPKPLAWHPQDPLLAAVDGGDSLLVFDYTGRLPVLGQGGAGGPAPLPLPPAFALRHELQQAASAVAWRPHGGKCVAVGVAHGVCLWHIGRPPPGSGSR